MNKSCGKRNMPLPLSSCHDMSPELTFVKNASRSSKGLRPHEWKHKSAKERSKPPSLVKPLNPPHILDSICQLPHSSMRQWTKLRAVSGKLARSNPKVVVGKDLCSMCPKSWPCSRLASTLMRFSTTGRRLQPLTGLLSICNDLLYLLDLLRCLSKCIKMTSNFKIQRPIWDRLGSSSAPSEIINSISAASSVEPSEAPSCKRAPRPSSSCACPP